MNYNTLATWSRAIAALIALAVSALYGAHLYQSQGNIAFAVGAGAAVFVALAGAWHLLFHYAEGSRRTQTIVAIIGTGFALYVGAMAISGAAVTTMLGGTASLASLQAESLPRFETALSDARSRIDDQRAVVNQTEQAIAGLRSLAQEEAQSGEGPNFRAYLATIDSFDTIAADMRGRLADGERLYERGAEALDDARSNLGNEDAVPAALSQVASAVREMNAIDLAPMVLSGGSVTVDVDTGTTRVGRVTEQLYSAVDRLDFPAVEVPAYETVSTEEAIFSGEASRYWLRAAVLEAVPLFLLVLLVLAAREPLLRQRPDPARVTEDEIRTVEDNVIGLRKGAAE